MKHLLLTLILLLSINATQAANITNIRSGSWDDPTIWDLGRLPDSFAPEDIVTIATGTTVTVNSGGNGNYFECDGLIINGFLDIGAVNLTIGGRDLQIDVRAVRNTSCVINNGGRLRVNGDFSTQFKVYGSVKFNMGSTFDMPAGAIMIDGCAYTAALSVPANTPLLDVTDASNFNVTGGQIIFFNPHYHPTGVTIKGAKFFNNNVSFGNNLTLENFGCRSTSDFLISETDKPTFFNLRMAYLYFSDNPNNPSLPVVQNRVVLNDVVVTGNLEMDNGIIVGSGRLKVSSNILLSGMGRIEADIECNGPWQQNITTFGSNASGTFHGNIFANNADRVLANINLNLPNGTIKMMRGKFDLNSKTVSVASEPTGATALNYIISRNYSGFEGTLVINNISSRTLFPVGTETAYLPVYLTAASGAFSVSAKPLLLSVGNLFSITNQWDINRVTGNAPTDVEVQWNPTNETTDFATYRANCRLHRFDGSVWQPLSIGGEYSNLTPYTLKAQGVQNFSPFTVLTQVSLPIELASFKGRVVGNDAQLFWETATESNNRGFSIEKSTNQVDFVTMGFVKGIGNALQRNAYNFTDINFEKTTYYRLKQVDFDDKFSYSPIIALEKTGVKGSMKIYPNPITTHSNVTIDFTEDISEKATLTIYESNGKMVFHSDIDKQKTLSIPVNNWTKGLYLIRLTTQDGKTIVSKFVNN